MRTDTACSRKRSQSTALAIYAGTGNLAPGIFALLLACGQEFVPTGTAIQAVPHPRTITTGKGSLCRWYCLLNPTLWNLSDDDSDALGIALLSIFPAISSYEFFKRNDIDFLWLNWFLSTPMAHNLSIDAKQNKGNQTAWLELTIFPLSDKWQFKYDGSGDLQIFRTMLLNCCYYF